MLNSGVIVERVWNLESRIYRYRNLSRSSKDSANRSEVSERVPGPIVCGYSGEIGVRASDIRNSRVRGGQELIGSVAAESLNIVHVDRRVRRNRSMPGCDHVVEIVDSVER